MYLEDALTRILDQQDELTYLMISRGLSQQETTRQEMVELAIPAIRNALDYLAFEEFEGVRG